MKKQIALPQIAILLMLALMLMAFLLSACDKGTDPSPILPLPQPRITPELVISSFHPNAAAPGSSMVIFGENFSQVVSDNHVTFGPSSAEVMYVGEGMLNVIVPNLPEGDYEIYVNADGQVRRAPQMFTIVDSRR